MKPKSRLIALVTLFLVAGTTISVLRFAAGVQAKAHAPVIQHDVQFGQAGGEKQLLDVYGADPKQKRPAIIFIHGGGWVGGSRNDMEAMGVGAAQLGYVGFSVGYRLVKDGKNHFPAQLDDVQRAVRFIRAHSAQYGIDPAKIGAMGVSAGGHLVSLLGTMETRDNSDRALSRYSSRVQCVVDICGPTDLTTSFKVNPTVTPGLSDQQGNQLIANLLGPKAKFAANYILASPIKHIDKKTVPFLIFHGAQDNLVPVEQAITFDAALRKAGIDSKLVVFPNAGHGFGPVEGNQATPMAIDFFKKHLQG